MPTERANKIEMSRGGDLTAFAFGEVIGVLDLPINFSGLNVLDIGSGFSPFTAEAQRRGAKFAVGVDRGYGDMDNFSRLFDGRLNFQSIFLSEQIVKEQRANKRLFLESLGIAQYMAALGGSLPFTEGVFDLCVAFSSISTFFMKDPKVLSAQVQEAMRVLKNGGELRMFPWPGPEKSFWTKKQKSNALALEEEFKQREIDCFLEGVDRDIDPYLRLAKR